LLRVVGRKLAPLAWGDGAAAWLAAVPANVAEQARQQHVEWPDVAWWTDDPAALAAVAAGAAAHLGDGPAGELAWLVLRHFARGVRGFAQSSPAYLVEQEIEARLSRAPLGVVLQMAGRTEEQGPVPWLGGRTLRITLP
jgi:hypothetical protein